MIMPEVIPTYYTQTPQYAEYMRHLGWQVVQLNKYFAYVKKIGFLKYSVIKIPRAPLELDYQKIEEQLQSYNPLLLKIEPNQALTDITIKKDIPWLHERGFFSDRFPVCQSKSIFVDLTLTEEQLLSSFRAETRHHLKKSRKRSFRVTTTLSDGSKEAQRALAEFYPLFEHCARERKFFSPFKMQMTALWESFKNHAVIILVYPPDKTYPVSGTLTLATNHEAYYKFGASLPEGREAYASYLLYWEMFKWAKKNGRTTFDLEGIYDPRYKKTKRYLGITQFKRGWSKNEITYLGTFTRYHARSLQLLASLGIIS